MEKYSYTPKGVCSRQFNFEIEDGIIKSFEAIGGCNGNLKGIGCLLKGRSVDEVIDTLTGVTCGNKPTSCPDQIACALKAENRPTGPGFYNGLPGYKVQLYQDHDETVTQEYVAIVQDYDKESQMATLQVKNHFMPNQDLEIFGPHILSTIVHVGDVYDSEDNVLEVCNKPMQIVHTKWSGPIEVDAMIRKIR